MKIIIFDYFRNYLSNSHQVCCADNPTIGRYDHCPSDDRDLHSRSQVCRSLDYFFNLQYLGQYLSYYIQTWHDGRLMHITYAHARLDDLELDLDFENVCKACPSSFFESLSLQRNCIYCQEKMALNQRVSVIDFLSHIKLYTALAT